MTNRDVAIDLIRKMPEDASPRELARELEFIPGFVKASSNWIVARDCPLRKFDEWSRNRF